MRRPSLLAFLTTGLLAVAAPAQSEAATGACVLAGGGRLPAEIFARFQELAGGAAAKVVLIPTASESADDAADMAETVALYRERLRGAEITVLHTRDRAVADGEAFCAPLREATGVWFGGGDQNRLAEAYLGTRVEREVLAVLARGGVVGGTSAGTAIQTRVMIGGGMNPPVVAQGFDCVPGAISDQHFLARERLPRLLRALAQHPALFGLGVDEGTAAVVRGDALEIVGRSKVVLALPEHNGHGALTVEAGRGDSVDLAAWRRAAAERANWSVAAAVPPRAAGTLLIGDGERLVERFVELAGGDGATVLVIGLAEPDDATEMALLEAGGAAITHVALVGAGPFGGEDLREAFAGATGLWFQDADPSDSARLLGRTDTAALRELAGELLARGGVVLGGAILGEAVALGAPPSPALGAEQGYRRGLGLLPGAIVAHDRPAAPGAGTTTGDAPRERLAHGTARLPEFTGLHVEGSALVRGSELEVIGELPAHVWLPARAAGERPAPVRVEPGARFDLVTGERR